MQPGAMLDHNIGSLRTRLWPLHHFSNDTHVAAYIFDDFNGDMLMSSGEPSVAVENAKRIRPSRGHLTSLTLIPLPVDSASKPVGDATFFHRERVGLCRSFL